MRKITLKILIVFAGLLLFFNVTSAATLTVYPDPDPETATVDGTVGRTSVNQTLTNIRAGAGTGNQSINTNGYAGIIQSSTTSNQFQSLQRGIWLFDASSLADDTTITAVTFSLYGKEAINQFAGTAFEIDVVDSTPASNTNLVDADYGQLGSTVFSSIAFASLAAEAYNDFALDASGIANVSLTGVSKFGTRLNWDTDNSFTGTWSSSKSALFDAYQADNAGTTKDPKLTITYTAARRIILLPD